MKQHRFDYYSSREATHTADRLLAPGKRTLTGQLGYAGADHQPESKAAETGHDLAKDLVPIVIDPTSARAASTAVKLHPAAIAASPDASVQRLFDVIGAHATDELSVDVLRGMLLRLGQIALDPGVTNADWQSPARVRDALHRWQTSSAELKPQMTASAAMKQEKTGPFTGAMQEPVSTERFLVRLDASAARTATPAAGTTMLDATRSTSQAPPSPMPTGPGVPGPADLCAYLLPSVVDVASAELAAAALTVNSEGLSVSPDASVKALFFAITGLALDKAAIPVLRQMMARIGNFGLDNTIDDADWKTPAHLGDALHRYLTDPAPLVALTKANPKVGHGAKFSESLQAAMTLESVLLHLEDLRDIIGVAIDPLATNQTYHVDFGKASGQAEIERIVKMGFHSVRVELQAPLREDHATNVAYLFFKDLVAYNTAHSKSPPITVDLVINMRGTIDNPAFGLDVAEIDENRADTDPQRTYALELLANMLAKISPDNQQLWSMLLALEAQATTKLTPAVLADVAASASVILGGSVDDYMKRLQSGQTMQGLGKAFGTDAASVVADLEARVANIKPYLELVELGNEPEAQWKTPGVKQQEKTTFQRNTGILDAALRAYEKAQGSGKNPAVAPAASEWDPASEQDVLAQIYNDITAKTAVTLEVARTMIDGSNWGHAFKAYAALHAHTAPTRTPLAIHIYNHPLLAQALIDEIATIAKDQGIIFDISVTELQIDGNTSPPKAGDTRQHELADGVLDLGVSVMAAAAGKPSIAIVQVTAFSYQHVSNRPGQEFSLRGNPDLTELIGDPTTPTA